jgi:hypothetical protein
VKANRVKLIIRTFPYNYHCFLQIDFSISLEESGIVVECSGTKGGVARDTEALTLLDNPTTRNMFIDDLSEVSTKHPVWQHLPQRNHCIISGTEGDVQRYAEATEQVTSVLLARIERFLSMNLSQDTDCSEILTVFLSPSRQIPGYYLDIGLASTSILDVPFDTI